MDAGWTRGRWQAVEGGRAAVGVQACRRVERREAQEKIC